jgi:DNA-directed RNA polymerase specialized sigma24 family protein
MPTTIAGRGDEADLYRRHHDRLLCAVTCAVNAPAALVEDACQTAWLILLRRQPDRATVFGWLRTVAVREAYRLSREERRECSLEGLAPSGAWEALVGAAPLLDEAVEARRALEVLAALPPGERADLALFIAGVGYAEIARRDARSVNNVNKHLSRARARIRRLEREAA